jgi:uncharacterized repeat protein (TIGR01451 family)
MLRRNVIAIIGGLLLVVLIAIVGIGVARASSITQEPMNQLVCAGSRVSLTAASANPSAQVQWQQSTNGGATWKNIPGATAPTFDLTAPASDNGVLYRAVFTTLVGRAVSNAAKLSVNAAPLITTQPTGETMIQDQSASFSAVVKGTPTPTLQWQVSADGGTTWNNIGGANSTTYTFTAQAIDNGSMYRAVLSNSCGTAMTNPATLNVVALGPSVSIPTVPVTPTPVPPTPVTPAPVPPTQMPPEITSANAATFIANIPGTFTITTTGAPTPGLTESGALPAGVTFSNNGDGTATLSGTPAAGTGGVYNITLTASNGASPAATQDLTLTVDQTPAVTVQPVSQSICTGSGVSFTGAASGFPTPSVQWQVSTDGGATWNDLNGATSNTLSFTADVSQNGYEYRARFTNSAGSTATNAATLTVNVAPAITAQPANQNVTASQTATFTAAASGSPPPSVQWQVSSDGGATWTNLSGATSPTLTFTAQLAQNGNLYRAVFTNACGDATSNAAQLTVTFQPITISGHVFDDLNGNGQRDPGEPGLDGWTVRLIDPSTGRVIAVQTTDQKGHYAFANLGPGTYRVREVLQPGWVETTPKFRDITAQSGVDVGDVNFGNVRPADLSLAGTSNPDPVRAGATLTYTLTVGNHGPNDAANVAVIDTLPKRVTFQTLAAPPGWACDMPAPGATGTVTCTVPTLNNGETEV